MQIGDRLVLDNGVLKDFVYLLIIVGPCKLCVLSDGLPFGTTEWAGQWQNPSHGNNLSGEDFSGGHIPSLSTFH